MRPHRAKMSDCLLDTLSHSEVQCCVKISDCFMRDTSHLKCNNTV